MMHVLQPSSSNFSVEEKPLTIETIEKPLSLRFKPKPQPRSESRDTLLSLVIVLKPIHFKKSLGGMAEL